MESAWIEVFILTLVECVAPAGKSVCQEQQFELRFQSKSDCEYALQQLITAKIELDYVIVDRKRSGCAPSAVEANTYPSLESISDANRDRPGWRTPGENAVATSTDGQAHRKRLSELQTCDETSGVAPCKIGNVIVEAATGESVEVWRRKD